MKRICYFFNVLSWMLVAHSTYSCHNVVSRYVQRSQGRDSTIQAINAIFHTNLYNQSSWNGYIAITPQYTQSFRSQAISSCLFGPAVQQYTSGSSCFINVPYLTIQGSNVPNRANQALLADYFYLPRNYNGIVHVQPSIRNIMINLDVFVGIDELMKNFYIRAYTPLTWTKWNLHVCEEQNEITPLDHPAGYFTPGTLPGSSLLTSFLSYAQGDAPGQTTGNLNISVPAVTGSAVDFEGLRYAKILPCVSEKIGPADVRGEMGYNFINDEDYHLGCNAQVSFPSGNRVRAHRLFAAQLGTNNWELGVGCTAHYVAWRSCDECISASIYFDLNLTHLFSAQEERTFDLRGLPLSRYMLALNMTSFISDELQGGTPAQIPSAQFQNLMAPLANISTLPVRVNNGIQADMVILGHFAWNNVSCEIGYNFWATSCEHIRLNTDACPLRIEQELWAIKGDARVEGYVEMAGATLPENRAVPLSAAESNATIFNGTNQSPDLTNPNMGITGAQLATADTSSEMLVIEPGSTVQINTSINPHIITIDDLDLNVRSHGVSHKIFASVNYDMDVDPVTLTMSIGGFAEFGQHPQSSADIYKCCYGCLNCTLSQWSVFIKLGVAFTSASC